MTELSQEDFLKSKAILDKAISYVSSLADAAKAASLDCCQPGTLDTRDQLGVVCGHLKAAESSLEFARAAGGQVSGNGVTRSGGT